MDSILLFWGAAGAAALGSLAAISARSPVRGVLALAVTLVSTALLFLNLHAPAAAAFQVMVYAGAILVLLLFVIMLLNLPSHEREFLREPAFAGATALLGLTFLAFMLKPFQGAPATPLPVPRTEPEFGSLEGLGRALFSGGNVYLLEILSLLLLAAIVGAISMGRREEA